MHASFRPAMDDRAPAFYQSAELKKGPILSGLAAETLFRRCDDAEEYRITSPTSDAGFNINDFWILAGFLLLDSSLALGAIRASA
jgi:hypothetical protein